MGEVSLREYCRQELPIAVRSQTAETACNYDGFLMMLRYSDDHHHGMIIFDDDDEKCCERDLKQLGFS